MNRTPEQWRRYDPYLLFVGVCHAINQAKADIVELSEEVERLKSVPTPGAVLTDDMAAAGFLEFERLGFRFSDSGVTCDDLRKVFLAVIDATPKQPAPTSPVLEVTDKMVDAANKAMQWLPCNKEALRVGIAAALAASEKCEDANIRHTATPADMVFVEVSVGGLSVKKSLPFEQVTTSRLGEVGRLADQAWKEVRTAMQNPPTDLPVPTAQTTKTNTEPQPPTIKPLSIIVSDGGGAIAEFPIAPEEAFSFFQHLQRQRAWSIKTFGPGLRTEGVVDHIRKELNEILAAPNDLEEWIDVVILALDGAWRTGATPEQIIVQLQEKQQKNEKRKWPDWRSAEQGKAIEHDRSGE